jgi:hypothetical protein
MSIFFHISTISCFVTKIIEFVAYNILIHQWIKWTVISIDISIRISRSTVYMIVPWISIIIYVSHIVVSCIDFTVNLFASKVSASITMTKKNILIPGRKGPSCCLTPYEL